MRIDPTRPAAIEPSDSQPAKPPATKSASSVVELSAAAAGVPASDTTQRVARIRELLERGAYPVDLDALASKIVEDEVLRTRGGK